MITITEENYLKAIFSLSCDRKGKQLGTNELAGHLNISPATVSSMLKKLKAKGLISYEKYGAISLLEPGKETASLVIRKHRLWETFLVEKLEFTWDEIHEVAEQLEHIKSRKLIDQLDKLLNYPEYDPHGDPIPKANGEMRDTYKTTLDQGVVGKTLIMVGVKDDSPLFLQYITKLGLAIRSQIFVNARNDFVASLDTEVDGSKVLISQQVAENIYVR